MTTRELEALQSGQLYDAGTLRFGRRRVRGMDDDAREEPTEAGDRGDGEVVVTEGNDAERLADLQERLELGERALEGERAERTREQLQRQDPGLSHLFRYLEDAVLPTDEKVAKSLVLESVMFGILDGILYFDHPRFPGQSRIVVPQSLRVMITTLRVMITTLRVMITNERSTWW